MEAATLSLSHTGNLPSDDEGIVRC